MTPPLTFILHPFSYPFWSFRHDLTMYPRLVSNLRKFFCLSLPSDRLKVMSHTTPGPHLPMLYLISFFSSFSF